MKTWVKFKEHYEICEETSELKSCARIIRNSYSNERKIKEQILKPQNGFLIIERKSRKVSDIYKEVFGKEFVKMVIKLKTIKECLEYMLSNPKKLLSNDDEDTQLYYNNEKDNFVYIYKNIEYFCNNVCEVISDCGDWRMLEEKE